MKTRTLLKTMALCAGATGLLAELPVHATGINLNLAGTPLYLSQTVDPNIFFELDDSGSMDWEMVTPPHFRACAYNKDSPDYSRCPSDGLDITGNMVMPVSGTSNATEFEYIFKNSSNNYGVTDGNGSTIENEERSNGKNIVQYDWRVLSAALNGMYYDPSQDYKPWARYDKMACSTVSAASTATIASTAIGASNSVCSSGTLTPTYVANFSNVKAHPMPGAGGYTATRNLGTGQYLNMGAGFVFYIWQDTHGYSGSRPLAGSSINRTAGANGEVDLWDEHLKYVVTGSGTTASPYTVTVTKITYSPTSAGALGETSTAMTNFSGNAVDPNTGGTGKTANQLAQQIATWYEFYRRRSLTTRAGVGRVIDDNSGFRYGMGVISTQPNGSTLGGSSSNVFVPGLTATNGTGTSDANGSVGGRTVYARVNVPLATPYNYDSLFANLYYFDTGNSTPLRRGLSDVVRYFDRASVGTPASNSSTYFPIQYSCQFNFSVLTTDGYYNDDDTDVISGVGDADGDGTSNTLADIAAKYGPNQTTKDLDTTLANNVPVKDNAGVVQLKQQNLVVFPVALGPFGKLQDRSIATSTSATDTDGWPSSNNVTSTDWSPAADWTQKGTASIMSSTNWGAAGTKTSNDVPEKIDDMWHAAYNASSTFVAAKSASAMEAGLNKILAAIRTAVSSSAALAATAGQVQGTAKLYLAQFNTADWTGNLRAYNTTTSGVGSLAWETNATLDAKSWSSRVVLTYKPSSSTGIAFSTPGNYQAPSTTELDTSQLTSLMTNAPYAFATTTSAQIASNQAYVDGLVNYLRGDRSNETPAGLLFRKRNHVLGDIINSAPEYVGKPIQAYPDTIATGAYSSFQIAKASRTAMVYAGANDGMLHGFDANTGDEKLAYIPSMVYSNLASLASTTYAHTNFVNGPINTMDIYNGTKCASANYNWCTVLVGSLGSGGKGLYALNVTDPGLFTTANASSIVWWEASSATTGYANMGYVYGETPIVKLNNGQWGVVVGNGYNSTSGTASVFIIDVTTGAVIKEFDTGVQGTTTTTVNGMAAPTVIDVDGDYTGDYIYAGDLKGNLWKIDITNATVSNWGFAYKTGSTPKPIFTTAGATQPITVQPAVTSHPNGGYLIEFGTGKYLETGDNTVTPSYPTQAFYAVWDQFKSTGPTKTLTASDLLQQTITTEFATTVGGYAYNIRITSNTAPNWSSVSGWYINLQCASCSPLVNGERAVTNPKLASDGSRIVFTTWIPSTDPCDVGGKSWLMELNALTGQRLSNPPFDLNKDGSFSSLDTTYTGAGSTSSGTVMSGMQMAGLVQSPAIVKGASTSSGGCVKEGKYVSDTTGNIQSVEESASCSVGRISWRYLN